MILKRKRGEKIVIGDNIVLTIVDVGTKARNQVRIGIQCPRDIPVLRKELIDRKRR